VIVAGQKVDRPSRSIELLAPLRQDLAEYMLATGRRAPKALLFSRPDGKPCATPITATGAAVSSTPPRPQRGLETWRNACAVKRSMGCVADGQRAPTAVRVRMTCGTRSRAREGQLSPAEIAEQRGNSVATLSDVYAHVIADVKGQPTTSAADAIIHARMSRCEQAQ
jgi:hypothetical protein